MKLFDKAWLWLAKDPHQLIGIRILQMVIGLMMLFEVVSNLPFTGFLWGPRGLGWGTSSSVVGISLLMGNFFDGFFATDASVYLLLFILTIGSLGLLFGYYTRISTLLVLIPFALLNKRLPELYDGGDNITTLVLIYMLFLLPRRATFSPGQFRVWLHNLAVLAIIIQLMIMYTTAGFSKAGGSMWQEGTALYYLSQVQLYAVPASHQLFLIPGISAIASYATLGYQMLFPIAIVSRLKVPWVILGILFHLGIAIMLGLISFSMAMIGLELFLISDQQYQRYLTLGCSLWTRTGWAESWGFSKRVRKT